MGSLPWSTFKAKLNERFTPHNQLLKDRQELLNLLQSDKSKTMGRYVQTFASLLILILMKEEYTQKVAFLHGSHPWACNAILQKSEVPTTYQKMMKVVECMEDDSMHKKARMPLISQLTTMVNIKSATQATSGLKRGQKRKRDKNPPKDNETPIKKKL
jgi:hypothetical protein